MTERRPEENVVPKHEAHLVVTDELLADDERVRDPARLLLLRVLNADSEARPVPEQILERAFLPGRYDDQNLSDPGTHQRGY